MVMFHGCVFQYVFFFFFFFFFGGGGGGGEKLFEMFPTQILLRCLSQCGQNRLVEYRLYIPIIHTNGGIFNRASGHGTLHLPRMQAFSTGQRHCSLK